MAENRREPPAQGQGSAAARSPDSRVSRGQQRRRQRSVFQYITILFAAALVLLLYTFMMERRQFELQKEQDQANISNLQQQSVSATQTLNGILEENQQLKEQVRQLQEDQNKLEETLAMIEGQSSQLQEQLTQVSRAMDWFWQIDEAYVRGRYTLCRQLIQALKDSGYESALPDTKATDNDRFTPAARYAEIYDALY